MNKNSLFKKITTFCLCLVLTLPILAACGNKNNDSDNNNNTTPASFELANTTIANFESYTAIGVNEFDSDASASTVATENYAGSSKKHKRKLVGIKNNCQVEDLVIKNSQNQTIEQTWSITAFFAFNNFTIVEYSNSDNAQYSEYKLSITTNSNTKQYVIDNNSGKIYLLNDSNIEKGLCFDITNGYGRDYGLDGFESDNALFLPVSDGEDSTIYKLSIENNNLKIQEIIKNSAFDFNPKTMFVDKFGNLFLESATNDTSGGGGNSGLLSSNNKTLSTAINYASDFNGGCIIKANGQIAVLDADVALGQNGIAYTYIRDGFGGNATFKKSTESGDFIECQTSISSFYTARKTYIEKRNLIKKVGNIEYYAGKTYKKVFQNDEGNSGISVEIEYNYVYKIVWENEDNYTFEPIKISDLSHAIFTKVDSAANENGIFFRFSSKIMFFDYATESVTEVVSNYIFSSLASDNLGNIVFTALNSNMQTVTGVIKNDGSIDTSVSESEYKVLYIAPLN